MINSDERPFFQTSHPMAKTKTQAKPKSNVSDRTDPQMSLVDRVYSKLEEMIVTLKFAPGEVLSEATLSAQLAVSRTPIGEALQRLAREGLVTILPRRGIVVTEVNIADQLKLLEVRRELSRYAARSAAKRANPSQRLLMKQVADHLAEASRLRDAKKLMKADKEFHDLFSKTVGNHYASSALDPLDALSRRFYFLHHHLDDGPKSARLHADLAAAIADGELELAANASDTLFDHLEVFTRKTLDF